MVTYRTDDPARWGVGKGSNLTAPEIDGNFWELAQRLVAAETNPAAPNNISAITVTGSQMIVHMDDGSTHGPFTLPTAMIHYRGDWAPGVSYDELDVIAAPNDQGIFLSTRAHVSAATFDRAAVDANGNPLYQWLFPVAGAATLGELTDVFVSAVELGQTVTWDGSVWVPGYIPSRLQDLNEVYFPAAPATGQFLGWDGAQWTPVDAPSGGGGQHMWRMRFVNSRTGFHNVREIEFRTAAGVARAATDASVIASDRWGSPERAIDGLTNNYTSLDSPVAGEYLGAAFPQFMDVVEFAINPYQTAFSAVDLDIEHSTDGGLTWQIAGQIRGATMADGVWSTFPVAIPADTGGGGSATFLGLSDTPAAFGAAGTLAAVNAAGTALEFIAPPSGGGATTLTGLSDVTIATPAPAQFLRHNGTEWVNAVAAWDDISAKPVTFPPSAHTHPWADVTGRPATIDAIPPVLGAAGQVMKVDAAGTGIAWAADDAGGGAAAVNEKVTNYTLALSDAGAFVDYNSDAVGTFTIPDDAAVNFPVGSVIKGGQIGAGALQIAAAAGVVLNGIDGGIATFEGSTSEYSLRKRAAYSWRIMGQSGMLIPPATVVAFDLLFSSDGGAGVSISADGRQFSSNSTAGAWYKARMANPKSAGSWYYEVVVDAAGAMGPWAIGLAVAGTSTTSTDNAGASGRIQYFSDGRMRANGVYETFGESYTLGDRIGILYQADPYQIKAYKNGVLQGSMSDASVYGNIGSNLEPHFCVYGGIYGPLVSPADIEEANIPAGATVWNSAA